MFQSKILIMHKLFNTNAHLGYRAATSNFQPYLYGFRNKIAIIDLDNTLFSLRRVCSIIQIVIRSKGHLLFVNTNPESNSIVRQTAERTGQSFLNHKWIGGLLTNWNHMQNVHRHFKLFSNEHYQQANSDKQLYQAGRQGIPTLGSRGLPQQKYLRGAQPNELKTFPRFHKMQKCFEGIVTQERPDCIVVFNANKNQKAIEEANRLQIPIICLIDSNVSNNLQNKITYPIPANADSLQFIYILCNSILKTIVYSKKKGD